MTAGIPRLTRSAMAGCVAVALVMGATHAGYAAQPAPGVVAPSASTKTSANPQLRAATQVAKGVPPNAQHKQKRPETLQAVQVNAIATRLNRPGFVSATPVISVSPQTLNLKTQTDIGAALNQLPMFQASATPQTEGGLLTTGNESVNLRGLGSSRTLVLLDGHRMIGANNLQSLPSILLNGAQIITGGASATWGSGAVAGVVNLSLNHKFTGFSVNVGGGISTYGDDAQRKIALAYGTSLFNGTGHFMLGMSYLDSDGIYPRAGVRQNVGNIQPVTVNGHTFIAKNVLASNMSVGGLVTSGVLSGKTFTPDGALRDFAFGQIVPGNAMIGGDPAAVNIQNFIQLTSPQKPLNLLASGAFKLGQSTHLTVTLRHFNGITDSPYPVDSSQGPTAMHVSVDNAFLSPTIKQQLLDAGEAGFTLGRVNSDLGTTMQHDQKLNELTISARGNLAGSWTWNAYVTHGMQYDNVKNTGYLLTDELASSLDSVIDPGTGKPVCRITLTNPNSGCVPIDVFGHGAPSIAATNYVTGDPDNSQYTRLDVGSLTLDGSPLTLPAGRVSVAMGVDWRRNSLNSQVDVLSFEKAFQLRNFAPMSGSTSVREAFGEAFVPVVKNLPGAESLTVDIAGRESRYSPAGNIMSWKAGVNDEVGNGVRLRAAISKDIRAPSVTDLFSTGGLQVTPVLDPISGSSALVNVITGGNPNLVPETARTKTFGLSWAPPGLPALSLAMNYYNINISNAIESTNAQQIVNSCAAGAVSFCGLIIRAPNLIPVEIFSDMENIGQFSTNGVDLDATYARPAHLFWADGFFEGRLMATWVGSSEVQNGASDQQWVGSTGQAGFGGVGMPRWHAYLDLSFNTAAFDVGTSIEYISRGVFDASLPQIENGEIGNYIYINPFALYKFGPHRSVEWYLNVNNLLNKVPPLDSNKAIFYDVIGRYFVTGFRFHFG